MLKNKFYYLFVITALLLAILAVALHYNLLFPGEPAGYQGRLEDFQAEPEAGYQEWLTGLDEDFTKTYDVIVAGTDPEGIAAALSSARNGLDTLLIDERERPGGLMVKGMLNTIDMNYNPEGKIVTRGIFAEFYQQLEGTSFNTGTAEAVFREMIAAEANLDWVDSAEIEGVIIDGSRVAGIEVIREEKSLSFGAYKIIDATVNAELAADAGAPYYTGMEDINLENKFQVATLVFELDNIDWVEARRHLNRDGDPNTGGDDRSLWGFSAEMQKYQSSDPDIMVRGLNIGRQEGARALVNSIHIFDVDPLDEDSIARGRAKAKEELPGIVEHIREEIPGFAEVEISQVAPELYLRQGRNIKTEKTLTINHVREHTSFSDRIALASYPVDIQRTSRDNQGFVLFNPAKYSIPYRSLIPLKVDNLLVVGRAAGFDSLAHGSARVIPVGMATGQAAGTASRLALENDISFRELAASGEKISTLQKRLADQGAYLVDFHYPFAGEDSPALEGIRFVNQLGLIVAGYDNDFDFEGRATGESFANQLNQAHRRHFGSGLELPSGIYPGYLTLKSAGEILQETAEENYQLEEGEALLPDMLASCTIERLAEQEYLSREESYQLIYEFTLFLEGLAENERGDN